MLVATDTGGRVLEMTHMLEQMWNTKESGLSAYSLAILSNTGYHVIHFAKQMVGCVMSNGRMLGELRNNYDRDDAHDYFLGLLMQNLQNIH